MEIRKIRDRNGRYIHPIETKELALSIESTLNEIGFRAYAYSLNSSAIRISGVRLNTKAWGHNISPYTKRRGNILNYYQWGLVNYSLNAIFDYHELSAKITSLNGLFVIRDGFTRYTFRDWEDRKWDNVGSVINPIMRVEAWAPANYEKFETQYINSIKTLIEKFGSKESIKELLLQAAFCVLSGKAYSALIHELNVR